MNPLSVHLGSLPSELISTLQEEFQKLHQQYFLGRWEPSQLDGGRFAEAVLRIVEYKGTGKYTPIGTQLKREQIVLAAERDTKLLDSLRFQVPRLATLVLDFRNKRNVGHLGPISVNEMDTVIVVNAANWIVAELVRLETNMSPDDAQAEIQKIIERKVPVIEEIGGRLKCLNATLSAKEKAMIFCYQKYPTNISLDNIFDWMGYSNKSVLRSQLSALDKEGLLDFRNDMMRLTRRGILWVEKHINFELEIE